MFTLLIATVIVLGFAGLNMSHYVFASAPVAAQTQLANGLDRVVIPVEGMSCGTCEIAVRHALKRIDGVKSARVSVATKTATVDYEPAKTQRLPQQIESVCSKFRCNVRPLRRSVVAALRSQFF